MGMRLDLHQKQSPLSPCPPTTTPWSVIFWLMMMLYHHHRPPGFFVIFYRLGAKERGGKGGQLDPKYFSVLQWNMKVTTSFMSKKRYIVISLLGVGSFIEGAKKK